MRVRWLSDSEARASLSMKWLAFDEDLLPAWVAEMDVALAPAIKTALHEAVELNVSGYNTIGVPEKMGLNNAVASWHERLFGAPTDPNSVIIVPSVIGAVNLALAELLNRGDGIILNPPAYHPFFDVIDDAGLERIDVPMEKTDQRFRLDLPEIESAFASGAKAILLCHPHNPTGSVATRDELEELARIVDRYQGLVISDEVHGPLVTRGPTFVPYATVSRAASHHSVTASSTSKAFNIAGLKVAWLFTDNPDFDRILKATPYSARTGASSLGLVAAKAAVESCDDWLDEITKELAQRHDLLQDLLRRYLPAAAAIRADAGFLAWVDFLSYPFMGDDPADWIKEHAKVVLNSGIIFGQTGEGYARLNVGTSAERLTRIIKQIADAVGTRDQNQKQN
jgi:cystathionine beta-lyase